MRAYLAGPLARALHESLWNSDAIWQFGQNPQPPMQRFERMEAAALPVLIAALRADPAVAEMLALALVEATVCATEDEARTFIPELLDALFGTQQGMAL